MQNINSLNERLKKYYNILSEEFPIFLWDYINTPEMQRLAGISTTCGTIYSKLFNYEFFYSTLDHSIAVALIIWNFTKDKKQTLSGLFHDIATPIFKHTIDFMNGDYETQESTEELTTKIIRESNEIMYLLNRDEIKIEDIADYHIYPIADNDTPQLSADRLEYTLSNGLGATEKLWSLQEIQDIYKNIEIQTNEFGIEELGFRSIKVAEKFVHVMSKLSVDYRTNEIKFSMQFLADTIKKMSRKGLITIEDLYKLPENEVINLIEKCEYDNISTCFDIWKNATKIHESDIIIENKYCVNVPSKIRYITPLVNVDSQYIRVDKVSNVASQDIQECLNYKTRTYAYLDF